MTKQHLGPVVVAATLFCASVAYAQPVHDGFYWIGEMNKASAVMVVDTSIVERDLGRKIAAAIAKVIQDGEQPGASRPDDYLRIEPMLIAAGGADVTRLHSGRSRQDMYSTWQRLVLREMYLDSAATLNDYRAALLGLARTAPDAIMPAFTMGVQAQPITLGHYISGYLGALERQAQRVRESYARLNLSPLGAAAVGTSSFPIDRRQLATLLGFDGPIENSFDANHVSPFDLDVEVAGLATASAITSGALMADLLDQYRQIRPWFLLAASETTPSSIMPQKRNPFPMLLAREQATRTLGLAQSAVMLAHNIGPGVIEYRGDAANNALREATQLQAAMAKLVRTLRFDASRALEEVNGDYATTTELADVLQRDANVPFRVGHHFASELVNFGRGHGLRASELPYDDAKRIFAQSTKSLLGQEAAFPFSEARFREILTPENMVRSSRGLGGPQSAEVARMLAAQEAQLVADKGWLDGRRSALAKASTELDVVFDRLKN
ncbi:argininosuccinate lyase [Bradyrhizobium forestalis]|uniref:argininosuccinate lyase n=1 Tax=Bradyrhizobium forestalis TaxID=1419263 RepID=A0A2M8REW0_9BRAD|nr:lyase family protein [Bradyrhizobium forestalis]PJG56347.1 argininosuccinate lyase [Bradyrhizobium forestalis]